jgi:hypothetical protein
MFVAVWLVPVQTRQAIRTLLSRRLALTLSGS